MNIQLPQSLNNTFTLNQNASISTNANKTPNKTGNTQNKSLNKPQSISEAIELLQEQIKKVNANERYDDETKEAKIKTIEDQIKELELLKTEQEKAALLKNEKKDNAKQTNNEYTEINEHGDTFTESEEAKNIINASASFDRIRDMNKNKAKMSSESFRLKKEMSIDADRAGSSAARAGNFKQNLIEKLDKGIAGIESAINAEISDVNKSVNETNKKQNEKETRTKKTVEENSIEEISQDKSDQIDNRVQTVMHEQAIEQEQANNSEQKII